MTSTTIGTISTYESGGDVVFEWKIENFFNLPERDEWYLSPDFFFGGERWELRIYPNGSSEIYSSGHVDLELNKCDSDRSIKQSFSLSLKTAEGEKYNEQHYSKYFDNDNFFYEFNRVILRSELSRRRSELTPLGVLTIVCTMKSSTSAGNISDGSLSPDFKKILLEGLNHDLILKVGEKELRAHRDVLRARSQVFKSMLDHDMKEKNSGVIDIPDCDPLAMEQFLFYIYSGNIEMLDQSNMLNLYYIADKYEMKGLKKECSDFIKESLSQANICDVIQLALNHNDSSLLESTTVYFRNNMLSIMRTVEWQVFLKENSTVANELLIKAVENLSNVKS